MAVLRPLRMVIDNYPKPGRGDDAVNNPEDPAPDSQGSILQVLYIEQEDFRETRPSSSFGLRRGARCACAMPIL